MNSNSIFNLYVEQYLCNLTLSINVFEHFRPIINEFCLLQPIKTELTDNDKMHSIFALATNASSDKTNGTSATHSAVFVGFVVLVLITIWSWNYEEKGSYFNIIKLSINNLVIFLQCLFIIFRMISTSIPCIKE